MLKEVFARRPPPQRPMQLAVDVFADAGRPCAAQLFKPRFDLVVTFEVLEHILPERQQAAMDYLAGSTSKRRGRVERVWFWRGGGPRLAPPEGTRRPLDVTRARNIRVAAAARPRRPVSTE